MVSVQLPINTSAVEAFISEVVMLDERKATNHESGVRALKRLLPIACGHAHHNMIVARFLLGCHDGSRFQFDLTDFRLLDRHIFDDCLAVLKMNWSPVKEVHEHFLCGGQIWEQMAERFAV